MPLIVSCRGLVSLHMSGTNISDEGKARIIMGLATSLRNLPRADYLVSGEQRGQPLALAVQADTLGWVDYLEEMEEPVFHIREFIPSTQYFFHEDWQMEMVARMCPHLEKLLFIHHPKVTRPGIMLYNTMSPQ